MVEANFKRSYDRVSIYEGGYVDHPRDPGGPTNRGIIQRVYDGYRRGKGLESRSVRQITDAEVRDIMKRQYWDRAQCGRLPAGVDFVVFDGAINSGPSQSVKWLQRALGTVRVDGDIGETTIDAANAHPDHDALIAEILRRRLAMLQSLRTWDAFGRGWSARIASVKAIGQAWASGSVGPKPVAAFMSGGDAKGLVSDVELPPVSAEAGTQTALGGGGTAGAIQAAKTQVEPLLGTNKWIDAIFVTLTVLAVVIAVGGGIYAIWAARKRRKAERAWSGEAIADADSFEAIEAARA
jgi:lysozyme family protein